MLKTVRILSQMFTQHHQLVAMDITCIGILIKIPHLYNICVSSQSVLNRYYRHNNQK